MAGRPEAVLTIGDLIGGWGRYQWNIFMFDIFVQLTTMANVMTIAFMAPKVDFYCLDHLERDHKDSDGPYIDPEPGFTACTFNGVFGNETEKPCNHFEFDTSSSPFGVTLSSEFSLVCDRNYLASVTQALYVFGYFIASLAGGYSADRFGRRPVLWVCIFGELAAGVSCAFTTAMWHFMISRFVLGIAVYGKFLTAYTMVMEVAGSKERTVYGPLTRVGRSVGIIVVTVIAYFARNFRYLQLAVTLPTLLLIYWLTTIPESPRWLLIKNRMEEAVDVVTKAAEINGIEVNRNIDYEMARIRSHIEKSMAKSEDSSGNKSFFDLFRTPVMRKNSLIMCFNWFITVFIYYALSLNVQDLGGNLFVNFFISGLVEIPSIALCIFALKRSGRRKILCLSLVALFLSSMIAIPFFFLSFKGAVATRVSFAMMGKFAATIAFTVNYLYSTEIYPTEIRQIGLGVNSAASRLGSMLSPFIKELNEHTHVSVTLTIFGISSLLNAFAVMSLPETRGREIPDTIEQVEFQSRKEKKEKIIENNNNIPCSIEDSIEYNHTSDSSKPNFRY